MGPVEQALPQHCFAAMEFFNWLKPLQSVLLWFQS